ncbi:MAG: polysaccharide deacetylase family protein [Actinomycetota bacterium]
MTVRRLLVATVLALVFLGVAATLYLRSDRTDSAVAIDSSAAGDGSENDTSLAPDPSPIATPEPTTSAATISSIEEIAPPALVEIPADLVSTPTPDSPTVVPLPFLTNIPAVPRDGSVVYLTFDDGPDPVYTNQVLDVLARYDAKATFFVLGSSVDAHPGIVQRMIAEGHTVGNHTYYHEALPLQEDDYILQTLGATNAAIARAVGFTTTCLRPPYGALDQTTFDFVRANGFNVHMWDVDSEDWQLNDGYAIASNVLSNVELGDRVLFHDGPNNRTATVAALESVLDVLSNRGVRFQALDC